MIDTNTVPEMVAAIDAGYVNDDGGVDVRTVGGMLGRYDHNGNADDHACIYRLWKPESDDGMFFKVFESGRVESGSVELP